MTPEQLAERQFELDRERTRRFPTLLERKLTRMSASPFAFLRGSAPLYYEALAADSLAAGPGGEGWIVGDLHLENFGAFRPARAATASSPPVAEGAEDKRAATFNLNDFDQALQGPWHWDVLRLLSSLILAGRELGVGGPVVLELGARLLESYVASACGDAPLPLPPAPVTALVERLRNRSREQFLNARTVPEGSERKFIRGERYMDLEPEIARQVPAALDLFVSRLAPEERPRAEQLELVDAAFRIAGTGSLGVLRIAALTRGKGAVDGGFIFDLKEQGPASAASLVAPSALAPAELAVAAFHAMVAPPPRMLATTELAGLGMVARRLMPQEDKLDLKKMKSEDLAPLAVYLGALTGAAHARGRKGAAAAPWSTSECADMLTRAVHVASLHEAVYLTWCLLLSRRT